MKKNGIINIHFQNEEDLNYVKNNWSSFTYANNSTVKCLADYTNANKNYTFVARDVRWEQAAITQGSAAGFYPL